MSRKAGFIFPGTLFLMRQFFLSLSCILMLALASEEKFFSFHRISSILILPQIGTILLLTLLQIYLLLSHRLQVKIMEETVKNLKKTDQIWGLKGLILCTSVPVWGHEDDPLPPATLSPGQDSAAGSALPSAPAAPSLPSSAPAPTSLCAPSGEQAAAHPPVTNLGPPPRPVPSSAGATAPTAGATQVPSEPAPGGSSAAPGSDAATHPGASGSSTFQQL
jgi:hypothetical protein